MPLQQTTGNVTADGYGGGAAAVPQYIEDVFSTYLYNGTGSTQTITNGIDLSTKGGMVWQAVRSGTNAGGGGPYLFDTARGALDTLASSDTGASYSRSGSLTSFNTTGFAMGSNAFQNGSGNNLVSWTFRKQAKFFDVVTYTGTGSLRTVSHSLGSVPGCIIIKNLSDTDGWLVYHRSIGATKTLSLNTTGAAVTDGNTYFNDTEPTSTQFTVNIGGKGNQSGNNYVAYLFAHDAGGFGLTGTDNVISCGTFTGSVSVNLGYEPQWLLVKNTGTAQDWRLYDTMRGWDVDGNVSLLRPNLSDAEVATSGSKIESTGFYYSGGGGQTYIYIAIRRGPMKVPTSGTSVFTPQTRTGTGSAASITGVGFPVDLVIDKPRTADTGSFEDRLRGSTQNLVPSSTGAESTSSSTWDVTSFASMDGIDVGISGNVNINTSGTATVNWFFRRAPSFFDEVCYTGTGSATTVTHNLGVAPELMIVKQRSSTTGWVVYSSALAASDYLVLNNTSASQTASTIWNSTAPTASVFSVGTSTTTNTSAGTYVAYLFATCAGVSKVGSYTGNGSTQTINCGFTGGARFVLIKRTDASGDWYVYDTARGMTTLTDPYLRLNSTAAESATLGSVTTVTTGFAVNASILAAINTNAASYIFLAIA